MPRTVVGLVVHARTSVDRRSVIDGIEGRPSGLLFFYVENIVVGKCACAMFVHIDSVLGDEERLAPNKDSEWD